MAAPLHLYQKMLRIRLIEERIAKEYSQQKMRCPVHLSIGQEAVAVGVCSALHASDFLVSGHRAHAHYLAKGGDLKIMLAEIYGKKTGCSLGRGGSMHLIDLYAGILGTTPIVGGSIPIGVGSAFSSKLKNETNITVIFFGEGATEEGVFSECLNFASLHSLPTLFVCENNLYSVYSPLDVRQSSKRDIVKIAKAHGVEASREDSNDVTKIYKQAKSAIDAVRSGLGPHLLEFATYRYLEHCGPNEDDHLNYRPKEEVAAWKEKCPLNFLEIPPDAKEKMTNEIEKEIDEAFDFAEKSDFPTNTQETLYAK